MNRATAGPQRRRLRSGDRPDGDHHAVPPDELGCQFHVGGIRALRDVGRGGFSVSGYGWWVVRVEGCNGTGCGPSITRGVTILPARPTNLAVNPSPRIFKLSATWDASPEIQGIQPPSWPWVTRSFPRSLSTAGWPTPAAKWHAIRQNRNDRLAAEMAAWIDRGGRKEDGNFELHPSGGASVCQELDT